MVKKIVFVEFQLFNISKKNVFTFEVFSFDADGQRAGAQRAKFAKKVHKPPLGFHVINFELNWFNASIWVPCNPSDPKKS